MHDNSTYSFVGKTHAHECASMLLKHIFSEVKDEDCTYIM